jgi:SAM-dependent methyltransferase
MSLLSRFRPLGWTPASLARASLRGLPNVPSRVLTVRYPFRLLRYWFMHGLLNEAARERSTPLAIAEVGVDHGQQIAFALHADTHPWWQRWDAYDCAPRNAELAARGYTGIVTVDLESAGAPALLPADAYDVVIACHVLEHLHDPETGVARMLKPGGMLIGGGPVTPHPGLAWRERRLRRTAQPHGHVSVLSPRRLRRMAVTAGLEPLFHSGAFLMRKRGFVLEDQGWWLRANLAFGALFPGWPGEIYFAWRRPVRQASHPVAQAAPAAAPQTATAAPTLTRASEGG